MQVVPVFGASFMIYVPIIMIIVALITLFDGFSKLLSFLRIESDDSGNCCRRGPLSEEEEARLKSGTAIIASELRQASVRHQELVSKLAQNKQTDSSHGGGVVTTPVGKHRTPSSYVNLKTAPEDEEDDEEDDEHEYSFEFGGGGGDKRHQSSALPTDEDEDDDTSFNGYGGRKSVYSSSLSANKTKGVIASSADRNELMGKGASRQPQRQQSTANPLVSRESLERDKAATASPAVKGAAPVAVNSPSLLGGWFGGAAKPPPQTILGTQQQNGSNSTVKETKPRPTAVTSPRSAAKPAATAAPAPTVRRSDMFALDDEDDSRYRGRYSDF